MNEPAQDWRRIADIVDGLTRPKYSDQELSDILGISRDTLKRRRNGIQPWRPGELQILANLSHLPIEPPDTS